MHTYLITIWQNNFSTNQQFTVTTDDPILWIVDRFGPDEFDDFACYKIPANNNGDQQ